MTTTPRAKMTPEQAESWRNSAAWSMLQGYQASRDHYEAKVAEEVTAWRARDLPWSIIAEALGVTKQAAQQKYGAKKPKAIAPADPAQLAIDV